MNKGLFAFQAKHEYQSYCDRLIELFSSMSLLIRSVNFQQKLALRKLNYPRLMYL